MQKEIAQQIEAIIERKFEVRPQGGYDPKAVDATLDEIIEICDGLILNWNNLCEKFDALQANYNKLSDDNNHLHQELLKNEAIIKKMETSGMSFAILNERLNRLESGKKTDPATNQNEKPKK